MIYAIVVVVVLILDQGLKYWTSVNIDFETGEKVLIPEILSLTNIHNEGAAFGLLEGWRWILIGIVVVFSIVVIVLVSRKIIQGLFGRFMAVLVMAGAIGNGIDRLIYGYVVDMFRFDFFPRFPVFNIADIFVTVCGVLFCLYVIFHKDYRSSDELEDDVPVQRPLPSSAGRQGTKPLPPPSRRSGPSSPPDYESLFNESDVGGAPVQGGRSPSPSVRVYDYSQRQEPSEHRINSPGGPGGEEYSGYPPPNPARRTTPPAGTQQRPGYPAAQSGSAQSASAQNARRSASGSTPGYVSTQSGRAQTPNPQAVGSQAASQRTPPKKVFNVNDDIPDFSLDDIIAEFSDHN